MTESEEQQAGLAEFVEVRPRLFGIAYRMLGSAAEADDVVQDAWLRWEATDRSVVVSAAAFLTTITTRLSLNVLQSARVRRESYVGPWLPEPVETSDDPALGAERAEAIELAVLVLLERLAPTERAAYVLREAFDYPHRLIAEILYLSEANSRQLVARARRHLTEARPQPVGSAEHRRLLQAFLSAAQHGDLPALEKAFAEDVVSWSDGGGKANAARTPVRGRARVAQFVASFASHFWDGTDVTWIEANGRPAVVITEDRTVKAVLALDASVAGIGQVLWIMNPDKLVTFAR